MYDALIKSFIVCTCQQKFIPTRAAVDENICKTLIDNFQESVVDAVISS